MTKIRFTLVLFLCIGLWSIPASAGPFDIPDHARAMREIGRALRIHHVDADWRSPATLPSVVRVRIRSHETRAHQILAPAGMPDGPGLGMRLDAPQRLSAVAGIPESTTACAPVAISIRADFLASVRAQNKT